MKPIIVDMKDMSDSTEVYQSQPNPFMAGLIYMTLAITVIAVIWMAFFRIDIVVKGTGTVAAANDTSTTTNQLAGTIQECYVRDGQMVKRGDILYIVSHEDLQLQLEANIKQQNDNKDRIFALKQYAAWLAGESSQLGINQENIYYDEFASRQILTQLGKDSISSNYESELTSYEAKLSTNENLTNYYINAISLSELLKDAISSHKNTFKKEDGYYYNKVADYLAQYQNTAKQYDNQIIVLQREKDAAAEQITNAGKIICTAETLIAEAKAQMNSLDAYSLETASVSTGDAMQISELQNFININEAKIQAAKKTQDSQRLIISAKEALITDYKSQKEIALNAYEKETISGIDSVILSHQQSILSYNNSKTEYEAGQENLEKRGTADDIENIISSEISTVANELSNFRQNQDQLEQACLQLMQNIKYATVRAASDGVVNLKQQLVKGDYVGAGTEILSVIPDAGDSAFIVKSYIANKDIAKITEGMDVTYEIAAYPSREYGTMRGTVEFVSADLKVNSGDGSAYYVVETSIMEETLRNRIGHQTSLKVGMLCETKVVIEDKSVLAYLLEKLNFFDS